MMVATAALKARAIGLLLLTGGLPLFGPGSKDRKGAAQEAHFLLVGPAGA